MFFFFQVVILKGWMVWLQGLTMSLLIGKA